MKKLLISMLSVLLLAACGSDDEGGGGGSFIPPSQEERNQTAYADNETPAAVALRSRPMLRGQQLLPRWLPQPRLCSSRTRL